MDQETAKHPLSVEINEYLDALWLQRGLSENTLAAYRRDLAQTEQWLINNKRSNRLIDASADDLGAFNATRSEQGLARRSAAPLVKFRARFLPILFARTTLTRRPDTTPRTPKAGTRIAQESGCF